MAAPEKQGKLFVISGASGTGKTTLCRALEKELGVYFSVSATTRPQRSGEVDGRDYRFLTPEQFEEMVRHHGFLEWAQVHENRYGTPRAPIEECLKRGQGVLLDLDTQGALQLKKTRNDAILIFVKPPSLESLKARLKGRGTEKTEEIQKRLAKAEAEIAESPKYDHIIINKDLDLAKGELKRIIKSYL